MAHTAYADYVIYFKDKAEYDTALVIAGGNGFQKSPANAATTFGLPYPPVAGPLGNKGMYGFYPFTPLVAPGPEIKNPLSYVPARFFSPSVDSVFAPCQPGNPPSIWPCPSGEGTTYKWFGTIQLIQETDATQPATNIPKRRWGGGFELRDSEDGGLDQAGCRDASRTNEGLGWAIRNDINKSWTRNLNQYTPGLTSNKSWERFYFRLRVKPSSINTRIWRCHGFPSDSAGARLEINSSGAIEVFNITASNVATILGTSSVLVLNKWYKVDILVTYNDSPDVNTSGKLIIFLDGAKILDFIILNTSGGLGDNSSRHARSALGISNDVGTGIEIDLDDWMNSEIPNVAGVTQLNSVDWFAGSHWRKLYVTAFGSQNSGGWAGQFESLNQMLNWGATTTGSRLTSITSGAAIDGITDANNEQDTTGSKLGVTSGVISMSSLRGGTLNGTLGYRLAGGAAVLTGIIQDINQIFNSVAYHPSGMETPTNIVPFSVRHDKAASIDSSTVFGIQATLENIGTFGLEDDPDNFDIPRLFLHNAYYSNTVWAFPETVPDGPVAAIGGTYVGNGTFQSINLLLPCHFLWIRPLTGDTTGGIKWFGAGLGGHKSDVTHVIPEYILRCWVDDTGQAKFTVVGTNSQINASGVTYQYVAFCDPGMRYNVCGAYRHADSVSSFTNPLFDPNFMPNGGFILNEVMNSVDSTPGINYKGPGHTVNAGSKLNGTNLTDLATFAVGTLTTRTNAHISGMNQGSYSLWRSSDGVGRVMIQMLSYTGDGTASKIITLTPTSERCPLFTLVVSHGGAASQFRDPSHTTNQSSDAVNGAIVTTGITAIAIDQITVGTTLNVNGIVYDIFIICGGIICGNDTFYPPPDEPPGPYPVPPNNPPPSVISIVSEGGIIIGGPSPSTPSSLLQDIGGIYTLVKDKTNDTLYDRQTGQTSVDVKIPDPNIKTGFIGG